ncbi:ATP-binding protein, partial [Citrobacter freundii]|uniref:ATP-binding protein n=1 Tax=Citrobacter freundii TaxID=546 RepID=UPI00351057CF
FLRTAVNDFMDSVHHIWCPLSSQEFQDLPDGAETTLTDETGKTITVEGEGVVAGDSDMLRRAFSNLLSNAIKYSPDNTCTAIHLERDSDCVNVMITNTMSGQVPANLERLFDRFYRADSSRVHNTEGAGLGLSITRSIIHAHGGELSAEQQGREIVFSVRLLMD